MTVVLKSAVIPGFQTVQSGLAEVEIKYFQMNLYNILKHHP